jgi:hypothetical protein
MSATAQLKFVQGGNVGAAATSLIGATGASVTASNGGDDTQNKTWTYTMIDVPLGSAVPTGVVQSGAAPTFSWTPDVTGGYYLQLGTVGNDNSQALDARSFGVVRPSGRYIPAFMSPAAGNNFAGQLRGWAKYLEVWLIYLDGLVSIPPFTNANLGQVLTVTAGPTVNWAPASGGGGGGTAVFPASGPVINGPQTVNTPANVARVLFLFQAVAGGYAITLGTITPGVEHVFLHVPGAPGTNHLETAGQAVTLSRGANTFTIEDPSNRFNPLANSALFQVSNQAYSYVLDNGVFRCLRQVQ